MTVATHGVVLLVETSTGRVPDAEELLAALRTPDPIPAALELLTAGGFAGMPAFGLLEHRGQSAHYVVRGEVELGFTGPGGERSSSGTGITTWSEQLVSGVDAFTIAAAGSATGQVLPLAEGAAWADRIEWSATDASAEVPAPRAEAAPTAPSPELSHATLLPPVFEEPAAAARGSGQESAPEDSLPVPEEGTIGYDHLFGVTMVKGVEAAAVRPAEEEEAEEGGAAAASVAPVPPAPAGAPAALSGTDSVGDHDGLTMMSNDIAELRRRAAAKNPAEQGAPSSQGSPSTGGPSAHAEPQFRLELPDGRSEVLDRPVIVGRSPSANKVSGSELPRLITIGGQDLDISRSHVRFTVEGGTVVITDLHSRNGTIMSLPGRPPQKLREGEPTSALGGTVVDLGSGIKITVTEVAAGA